MTKTFPWYADDESTGRQYMPTCAGRGGTALTVRSTLGVTQRDLPFDYFHVSILWIYSAIMINFRDITELGGRSAAAMWAPSPPRSRIAPAAALAPNYSNRRADRTELQKRERETCSPSPSSSSLLLARSHGSLARFGSALCLLGFDNF